MYKYACVHQPDDAMVIFRLLLLLLLVIVVVAVGQVDGADVLGGLAAVAASTVGPAPR